MRSNKNSVTVPKGALQDNKSYCVVIYKYRWADKYPLINPISRKTEWHPVYENHRVVYAKIMLWGKAGRDGQVFQQDYNNLLIREGTMKKQETINLIDVIDVFQFDDGWKSRYDVILKNYKRRHGVKVSDDEVSMEEEEAKQSSSVDASFEGDSEEDDEEESGEEK